MSWIDTTYEKAMKRYFIDKLGEVKGVELYEDYASVRNAMVKDNFFPEIKGVEPNLSDHSERHIQDVFERTYKVLGNDGFKKLDVYEIYCLALMILFHDVGNIFGRDGHESIRNIAEVYNRYRNNVENYREERRVISVGASAHSGRTKDGSKDTLKTVNEDSLKGHKIDLRELAAILRFSDELAEGKQRTCSFLINNNLIDPESEIYHKYAQITEIQIDRNLERISIKYDIDIPSNFDEDSKKKIEDLIRFTYYRAVKLDIERRYTKYYSEILKSFKYVAVHYNFSKGEIPIEVDLEQIIFEDRYPVPGEDYFSKKESAEELFVEKNSNYEIIKLIENLNSAIV